MRAFTITPMQTPTPDDFRSRLLAWRRERDEELRAPDGWLAVVALVWLVDGDNPLPEPYRRFGTLRRTRDTVTWHPADGAPRVLRPDTEAPPDTVALGDARMQLLRRGARLGVRLRDPDSPHRTGFRGRLWYPPDPRWRIDAAFHPYPKGRTLGITNVLGDVQQVPCPGYATFDAAGERCRLETWETPDGLFLVFADATAGKGTYPAGRFLDAAKPAKGRVTLDFNRAVNPPCAFTAFATCPLPPPGNRLKIAVPAGERFAGHG